MSHRLERKQAARAERLRQEAEARKAEERQTLRRRAGYAAVGVIAAALITLAVVLGGSTNRPSPTGSSDAAGPAIGATAPEFSLIDVVSGNPVSSKALRGKKTMLFFSEGVNCQACMVQAADLEKDGTLNDEGIQLVSVTNDQPTDLAQAAKQYGITAPLLADPGTQMTARYGMLGHGGMGHPQIAGHAFMLLDEQGKVVWHKGYQEMYVETSQLLADITAEAKA